MVPLMVPLMVPVSLQLVLVVWPRGEGVKDAVGTSVVQRGGGDSEVVDRKHTFRLTAVCLVTRDDGVTWRGARRSATDPGEAPPIFDAAAKTTQRARRRAPLRRAAAHTCA